MRNLDKKCYELRRDKTFKNGLKLRQTMKVPIGTAWYRAKVHAKKTNQSWPIELDKKYRWQKQVYNYRLKRFFSWWKISKLINRPMRLCKMYSKLWAKRNKRSLDPILN